MASHCMVLCSVPSAVQLEQQIQQLDEQRQHVAVQLEQLEGLEGGKDQIGVSDLKQQLQVRSNWLLHDFQSSCILSTASARSVG